MATEDSREPGGGPLDALDLRTITGVVRRALNRPDAMIDRWSVLPMAYSNLSPESRSLHRVSGTANDADAKIPWSLVVKVFERPEGGTPGLLDPRHYEYWQREPLVYGSGILTDLPGGLRAAACYGVDARSESLTWVWMEDLEDNYRGAWPLARFALAARHLGEFNGAYLAGRPAPAAPWLADAHSVDVQYSAANPLIRRLAFALLESPPNTVNSAAREALAERGELEALHGRLSNEDAFSEALGRLPQTFCHNDAIGPNLFSLSLCDATDETVAIDWALTGIGPVGSDLANLVGGSTAFFRWSATEVEALEEAAFEAYIDGLMTGGLEIDRPLVRLGYLGKLLFSWGGVVPSWLNWALDPSEAEWVESFWKRSADDVATQYAPLLRFLGRRAREATELLENTSL